jgi:hypothetical protein
MINMSGSRSLGHADRVVDSLHRSIRHAESEYVVPFSTATVMDTVSTPAQLQWSDSLAWVAPRFTDQGKLTLEVATDLDGIRRHYDWVTTRGERDRYALNARLASEWWVIWDAAWSGVSPWTGEHAETQAFSLHFTDGAGISSEMTSMPLAAPKNQTHAQRDELFKAYFDAVRAGDVARIMTLFSASEYVGSAIRDYLGRTEDGLLNLGSLEQLREHYDDFYRTTKVEDVAVMNWYLSDWYLFVEARWRLQLADGTRRGMITAEVMMLGSDGAISGRLGYGTPLESHE